MINLAVLLAFLGDLGRAGEDMARCSQMRYGYCWNGGEDYVGEGGCYTRRWYMWRHGKFAPGRGKYIVISQVYNLTPDIR